MMLLRSLPALLALALVSPALAQSDTAQGDGEYTIERAVPYRSEDGLDDYARKMCVVDLYYPTNRKDFVTIVWFHGGGLTGGSRELPKRLQNAGHAIVGVEYRLSPNVKGKTCIEDAAAAIAWTFKNIEGYGGSREKIIVAGHSAGAYLTAMAGFDKQYLDAHGIDANDIAGLVPYSGQAITHFTVRKESGFGRLQPIINDMAPVFHVRKDAPPTLLITGDRDLELWGRYEENAYLWRMMQLVEHPDCELLELEGYDHGMTDPAHPLLLKFVNRICPPE